jgi:hypothetical protein
MSNDLTGKYFVRKSASGSWEDVTTKWAGVKVLSIDGFNELGEAINVFKQQWMDGTEDITVTEQDGQGNDVIRRANVDLKLTFIVSRRYTSSAINEETVYNNVISYMCKSGAFYVKSAYTGKQANVICLKPVKPTAQKLNRGKGSYILATIELHCKSEPTTF